MHDRIANYTDLQSMKEAVRVGRLHWRSRGEAEIPVDIMLNDFRTVYTASDATQVAQVAGALLKPRTGTLLLQAMTQTLPLGNQGQAAAVPAITTRGQRQINGKEIIKVVAQHNTGRSQVSLLFRFDPSRTI